MYVRNSKQWTTTKDKEKVKVTLISFLTRKYQPDDMRTMDAINARSPWVEASIQHPLSAEVS